MSHTWPSREEWAKQVRTLYLDNAPGFSYRLAEFASEAEIAAAITALKKLWLELGCQMRTFSKASGRTHLGLSDRRKRINKALQEMRNGKLPSYIDEAVKEMFAPFYDRQYKDREERVAAAVQEAQAKPIDDAAWEKELLRRKQVHQWLSNPSSRFIDM